MNRARRAISALLVVLASLLALVGGVVLYAREEIASTPAFVDRAADAIGQPAIKRVVSREIAVQLLEPALPDAVSARPVINGAVNLVVGSGPFRALFRLAAQHGHRLLFERHGGNAVFDVADAGSVVTSALRTLSPKLAKFIPARTDAVLMTLRRRNFADKTLRAAETVRVLGIVLPPLSLALFAVAIAVAPVRRSAITRSALALGSTAIVFAIVFELFRRYALAHVYGGAELSSADVRAAVGELWGAYLDDLLTWTLAVAAGAWLLAAASSSLLAPYSARAVLRRARELASRPRAKPLRAGLGAVALAVGVYAVVRPTLFLQTVIVACGCLLIYIGFGELLTVTAPARRPARGLRVASARHAVALGAVAAAIAAGIVVAVVLTGAAPTQAQSGATCNGYAQLCGRRLDEVAFAGTHNSMSAADSPGWYIANQDRAIDQQLQDGIRAFKISTHYAVEDQSGWVHTDIAAEGGHVNRVAEKLVPSARSALQRFSRSLGGGTKGRRDIWLCHTLCELGGTQMVAFFRTIRRFLELNPNQVLVFFDEDYVQERDLRSAFMRAGVFRYLARLQPGQPLPTLGQLIRSHRNLVLFAQEPTSGRYPWNPYAFDWIQDTPLGARKPSQFTCKPSRGRLSNPLLMMNNWSDIFPPRPSPNVPLVKRNFILARSRQCVQQRGRIPNLILTDYYNRGDVVGAVASLNGMQGQKAVRPLPVKAD